MNHPLNTRIKSILLTGAIMLLGMAASHAGDEVSFNKHIRPIFINKCTKCHGGVKADGDLSLIYRAEALGKGRSGNTLIDIEARGRDHNPGGYTIWMAGAGVKRGYSYGETDPIGYKAVTNPVSTQDLQSTILHLMGMKHNKLTFPFQGLDQTLPGVTKPAHLIRDILA